ncbi:MAG TPA: DnaA regulatory inactivator Hda [Eoetvoesiella sp.]|jgi:DnaA family protein|uniref:DnaA regulatory inactivator Hda n=1 Tax=Eoetvoesiella sp. TaxID=1966355 RepID=UPI002CC927FD|nr:DnaA regulatory inactivator Hda [Eoetvoesiella sp.]HWK60696.1 DnaA regulatory inactivator Hda [Eoetvoesiella sp.]
MTQQLILDLLPAPAPTLDNFVVGENGVAIDALRQLRPGRAIYLWGASGAGRSHLLRALASAPLARYFDAQSSAADIRGMASAETMPCRLIAVDDIHRLDEEAQAALFALYNRWRETSAGEQAFALLGSGDRSPRAMPLREDLRTRLGWDLVFGLEQLSDDDRAQALRTQAAERGLQFSPEVIGWILTHYARDMGRLSALVDALDRYSLEKHRAITLPLLKDLLASSRPPKES